MTHDGQDIDDVADAILRPHAAAQAQESAELARRRKARSRFVRWAAAVIAISYAVYLFYR